MFFPSDASADGGVGGMRFLDDSKAAQLAKSPLSIQELYKKSASGSVIEIPRDWSWNGTVNDPDPSKHVTWIFDGAQSGYYPAPAGDGDISISYDNGFSVGEIEEKNKTFIYPASFLFWNADSNFCGMYCNNYQQYSSLRARAISGPTSTGNTSPIVLDLSSYGNNPSSAYDVVLPVSGYKYGQNSMWGIVDFLADFSAKSPGAFAQWNEFDFWANGQDVKAWGPTYGVPQSGHRSAFFVSLSHLNHSPWTAATAVKAATTRASDTPEHTVIKTEARDGNEYVWYAVQSGRTGTTPPTFPAPAKFIATIAHGSVLKVTSIASGTISIGDYVTGEVPVMPVEIMSQISGTPGGVGTYQLSDRSISTGSSYAMYSAPRVADGTAIWQFGEENSQSVSSILWIAGGNSTDTIDQVISGSKTTTVTNAWLDTTLTSLGASGAVLRMAQGQKIDFSGDGTLAGRNRHTLDYTQGALRYDSNGRTQFSIEDNGIISVRGVSIGPEGRLVIPFGTPSSSSAPCQKGQMQMDERYIYSCVAMNTWHRMSNGEKW